MVTVVKNSCNMRHSENRPTRSRGSTLVIPYWFPTFLCGIAVAAPWIAERWRFRLRSLLIATTLVAVVLGVIVVFAR